MGERISLTDLAVDMARVEKFLADQAARHQWTENELHVLRLLRLGAVRLGPACDVIIEAETAKAKARKS